MARLFPRKAGAYNDVPVHCPSCHKQIIIFEGFHKKHRCYKCGHVFRDRLWKENNAAYKNLKAVPVS